MATAKSLRDLLRIREANREYIASISGNLGSALGFKRPTGKEITDEPAILIFVAGFVAYILVSLYMPIFSLGSQIKS